ncbi:Peptidyl-prolyl cis-trans isomerase D [Auxenochlorella protothecoides]|uniref:Peptidyl-prolyl cis-trans isomerase D n=1 Tax=Auxenochlorella protothecoides TaxID=3075 RepID=A0A087SKE0_AUXPR|nr:Peptidyl-prolyl cis-trans isomerase D [Auxenochlorella protothecoides]KFM26194.1 Peptidyl-prolyl cis-trans isomerase D [Auxenochlorella protothecoides]
MFNPEMMRMAQEMMSRMTPEQMAEMQRQAASMSPDMMQQAMRAAQGASPEDIRRAQAAAAAQTPESLLQQAQTAIPQLSAREKMVLSASETLKQDGNALHRAGKYEAAAEKYARAVNNLTGRTDAAAVSLRLGCQNNLGSCHLALGRWSEARADCDAVLAADPANRKALYRRGQALLALQLPELAVRDLAAALGLAEGDDRDVIAAKLAEARKLAEDKAPAAQAPRGGVEVEDAPPTELRGVEAGQPRRVGDVVIEEDPRAMASMLRSMDPSLLQSMAGSGGLPPGTQVHIQVAVSDSTFDPAALLSGDMVSKLTDPATLKTMQKMLKAMPPETLQQIGRQAGVNISPEMVHRLGNVSEKTLERIARASSILLRCAAVAKRCWALLRSQAALVFAIALLLLAIFLRWRGWAAAQRAVTFQRQGTLACGAGLLVLPLPKDRLEDAATLLNDSFAESLGYISMYRSYLQSQIRQYLRQHLPLLPKTVILAAFRVGDEQGAELAVEGSGDAEGEEEHLDHEPECELVGIVELSFSASTRTKALTLNPPPEHAYLSNMAVSQTMRRQGIGSFLLSSAEELAQTMGHTHVYLHSRVDDAVGVRMYSRAGYETVSQDSGMVRLIGVDPRYLMSKPCGSRGALAELAAM